MDFNEDITEQAQIRLRPFYEYDKTFCICSCDLISACRRVLENFRRVSGGFTITQVLQGTPNNTMLRHASYLSWILLQATQHPWCKKWSILPLAKHQIGKIQTCFKLIQLANSESLKDSLNLILKPCTTYSEAE